MTSIDAFNYLLEKIKPLYGLGESNSIAHIVMEDAFGIKRFDISDKYIFTEKLKLKLNKIIARLLKNEPVQYILGETQFFGLKFYVNPSVLIPRQETEELVAWVLETAKYRERKEGEGIQVLDVGTGSGCIPISLKYKMLQWDVHALDVSEEALATAKENAELNQTEINFHHIDILNENKWEKFSGFDIIISNPPYITEKEKMYMPPHVLEHEPHLALFSTNGDAQQFIKKITAFAKEKLKKDGLLFFETNEFYGEESKKIMEEMGMKNVELRKDLNGKDRMLRGEI